MGDCSGVAQARGQDQRVLEGQGGPGHVGRHTVGGVADQHNRTATPLVDLGAALALLAAWIRAAGRQDSSAEPARRHGRGGAG
jgi:hypothetical protein